MFVFTDKIRAVKYKESKILVIRLNKLVIRY